MTLAFVLTVKRQALANPSWNTDEHIRYLHLEVGIPFAKLQGSREVIGRTIEGVRAQILADMKEHQTHV